MLEQERIEGLVRRVMGKHARSIRGLDREDVLQSARLAALQAMAKFRTDGGAKETTYVYAAIRNAVLDEVKRIRRRRPLLFLDKPSEGEATVKDALPDIYAVEPWYELDRQWFWQVVAEVLGDPVLYRVLRLTFEERCDGEETAEDLAWYERGRRRERDWVYHARDRALERLRQSPAIREEARMRDALCLN